MRGAVELKARWLANTVLSAGWESSWRSEDRSCMCVYVCVLLWQDRVTNAVHSPTRSQMMTLTSDPSTSTAQSICVTVCVCASVCVGFCHLDE